MQEGTHLLYNQLLPLDLLFELVDCYLLPCVFHPHLVVSVNDMDLFLLEYVYNVLGFLQEEIYCSSLECALDSANLYLSFLFNFLNCLFENSLIFCI